MCDPHRYHSICDRQTCSVVPANQWTIPGDDWVFGVDWAQQDADEFGAMTMLTGAMLGASLDGALARSVVTVEDAPDHVSPWTEPRHGSVRLLQLRRTIF